MTALRFHREVYAGTAVDEAVKLFGGYARFELREEPEHWVVELSAGGDGVAAPDAARERRIAGELANYALGLTVKKGSAR